MTRTGLLAVVLSGIGVAGVLAVIAALCNGARTLLLLFAVSFVPFGLYMIGAQNRLHWFGVLEGGYVIAAVLMGPS